MCMLFHTKTALWHYFCLLSLRLYFITCEQVVSFTTMYTIYIYIYICIELEKRAYMQYVRKIRLLWVFSSTPEVTEIFLKIRLVLLKSQKIQDLHLKWTLAQVCVNTTP